MTDAELKAIDQRLAAMSERVEAVIEKESLGKPMPVLDFKPRVQPNERNRPDVRAFDTHVHGVAGTHAGYSPLAHEIPISMIEGSIEQIFADFERQFDEMAQAHRNR